MKSFIWITSLSLLSLFVLFGTTNCSTPTSVSPEEYDTITRELTDCKNQISALQGKLDEAAIAEIKNKTLVAQVDEKENEIQAMKSKYDELNVKYEQLMRQLEDEESMKLMEDLQTAYNELNVKYNVIVSYS